MDRRTLIKKGGIVLAGGLAGCAPAIGRVSAVRPMRRLVPVNASWDRVIRTTVGLRPFRPSGFVLRAERFGTQTLVHNFGHGGSGMSLSWGTAQMAADLALEQPGRRAAVIGCGVVGLTTTRQLQRRGFDVTIYAMSVPPNTTSNMSLAAWTPTSGLVSQAQRTTEWDAQLRRAARLAYGQLQLLVGPRYGVSWIDVYTLGDSLPATDELGRSRPEPLLPPELNPGSTILGPGEHPFPTRYATVRPTLRFEPSVYLEALVQDVRTAGVRIVIRKFDTMRELATLTEDVIVNCTGLGSGELVGDPEIRPTKGQLTHLVPQQEVDYSTFGGLRPSPSGFLQMQPRGDGIALGGVSEQGNASLEPDEDARRRIVDAHIELFSSMRSV
jgi:glycine/D-amino acid oxidase-like deaminating enzyme